MFGPVSDMVPSTPIFEMYPLGFTTMAEYMERHGLKVRIVNLAVLMLNRPDFDVERAIREMDPVAFGIDLHWLPHAHGSVEIAKIVKKYHPNTPVLFGGLSASYFHEELATYPCVDYVVRGDSTEEPITRLLYAIKGKGSVADIPNVTWKTVDGSVVVNPLDWVPGRHERHLARLLVLDALGHPQPRHDGQRALQGLAAVSGVRLAHVPRLHAQLRDLRRQRVRVPRALRTQEDRVPRPRAAGSRHRAHPALHPRAPSSSSTTSCRPARTTRTSSFAVSSASSCAIPSASSSSTRPTRSSTRSSTSTSTTTRWRSLSRRTTMRCARAFGKKHYTMAQVEDSIRAALRNGCKRFDLYFMTGIPNQSAASILETTEYVAGLYERVGRDPRLLAFSSPDGAVPRSRLDGLRRPRGVRLHAAREDAGRASATATRAVVEVDHELREQLRDPRRARRRAVRSGPRAQSHQGRGRHHHAAGGARHRAPHRRRPAGPWSASTAS